MLLLSRISKISIVHSFVIWATHSNAAKKLNVTVLLVFDLGRLFDFIPASEQKLNLSSSKVASSPQSSRQSAFAQSVSHNLKVCSYVSIRNFITFAVYRCSTQQNVVKHSSTSESGWKSSDGNKLCIEELLGYRKSKLALQKEEGEGSENVN